MFDGCSDVIRPQTLVKDAATVANTQLLYSSTTGPQRLNLLSRIRLAGAPVCPSPTGGAKVSTFWGHVDGCVF